MLSKLELKSLNFSDIPPSKFCPIVHYDTVKENKIAQEKNTKGRNIKINKY
jgi:hypothetical protein